MSKRRRISESLSRAVAEAFVRIPTDTDWKEVGEKLQLALDVAYPVPIQPGTTYPAGYNCIISIYADRIIYECAGDTWSVQYTLGPTGDPLLSQREKVKAEYVTAETEYTAKFTESITGNLIATQSSEKGMVWDIQILREGFTANAQVNMNDYVDLAPSVRGKRGRAYYTAEALQQAVEEGKFNLAPFILRTEEEHASYQNGRSQRYEVNDEAKRMAGAIDKTFITTLSEGQVAIQAKLRLKNSAAGRATRDFLVARIAEGLEIPYEVSWTGDTKFKIENAESQEPTLKITKISEVASVDPCLKGNAGGKIMRMAESMRVSESIHATTMTTKQITRLTLKYGAFCLKYPKVAKLAEAADDGGGDTVDIEQKVAAAFLKDNPAVAAMFKNDAAAFLANENAADALDKWLDEKLGASSASTETPTEEDPAEAEAAMAEALRKAGKLSPEFVALQKVVSGLQRENEEAKLQVSESYLESALERNPHLQEGQKNFVRLVYKNYEPKQRNKGSVDALIAEAQKNMVDAGSHRTILSVSQDERDKKSASLVNFFARGSRPGVHAKLSENMGFDPMKKEYNGFTSLREIYRVLEGRDISETRGFGLDKHGRLSEAFDPTLTTQLAFDALHLVLQAEWEAQEMYDDWRKVVRVTPVTDFRSINTENFGYFKSSDITERTTDNADYAELAMTGVENAPYKLKDYGALFSITWKDFVNDNVGKIQRLPRELANVFKRKLYFDVFDAIWATPFTTWAGTEAGVTSTKKIVDTAWGNAPTSAAALSYNTVIEGFIGLFKLNQLGTDAPIGTRARFLLTMAKDFQTGYQVTMPIQTPFDAVAASTSTGLSALTANRGITALSSGALPLDHIVVPYWDAKGAYSRFFMMADPAEQEGLNVFLYNNMQEPLLMQEAVGTGKSFSSDQIRFKLHFPQAVGFNNPRCVWGNATS